MTIDPIENLEGGLSVRNKLNEVISDTNANRSYETRAEFVSAVAGGLVVDDGGTVRANGYDYRAVGGVTDISDLPGFLPLEHMFHVSQFPSVNDAYDYAEANNLVAETDEPNRFRGSQLTAGFNDNQNDGLVSYAVQVNSSKASRVDYEYSRVSDEEATTDPGAGNWSTNAARTVLRFNDLDTGADDRSKELKGLKEDMTVTLTETGDATSYAVFTVNADATDQTSYVELTDVTLTETGSGGFPDVAQACDLTSVGTQRNIALAASATINDVNASGATIGFFGRATSNVNAPQNTQGVRASAIGTYGAAVLRGPEPDGTVVTTGEIWGDYNSATTNQTNGVVTYGNRLNRASNAASGDPGTGAWGTNTALTSVRVSYTDDDGGDLTSILAAVGSGYKLTFFKSGSKHDRITWDIVAAGTDNTTYIQFDGLSAPAEGGTGTSVSDACRTIVLDGNNATKGKLVGVEIKAAPWGIPDVYDPLTATGENLITTNIDFVSGSDADNAFQQTVSTMMHNGNDTVGGWLYAALFRNVRNDYMHFYQPLGDDVRGIHIAPEDATYGTWADEVVVLPPETGIGWYDPTGTTIEPGITKVGASIEIQAPSRFIADGNVNVDWRSTATASTGIFSTLSFDAQNDAAENVQYVQIQANSRTVTDGTEDGRLQIDTMKSGALTTEVDIDGGVAVGTPQGSTQGVGSVNAERVYQDGVALELTRAEAITYLATTPTHADGVRFRIDNLIYEWESGATTISDLPNLIPVAPYMLAHWNAPREANDGFAPTGNASPMIQAAHDWIGDNGGGELDLGVGTIPFGATVYIGDRPSPVTLVGYGRHHGGNNKAESRRSAATRLYWTGTAGGDGIVITSDRNDTGTAVKRNGGGIVDVFIDGGESGGNGVRVLSHNGSFLRISLGYWTNISFFSGILPNGTAASFPNDTQLFDWDIQCFDTLTIDEPIAHVVLNGDGVANTSKGRIRNLDVQAESTASAIHFGNCDSIYIDYISATTRLTASGDGGQVFFHASDTLPAGLGAQTGRARAIIISHAQTNRGTTALAASGAGDPSENNMILNYSRENGATIPTIEAGASLNYVTDQGVLNIGQITGDAVQSSRSDTTADRVLLNGAHGVGVVGDAITLADIDAATIGAGFYRTLNTTEGDFPPSASQFGMLQHEVYNSLNQKQTYTPIGADEFWFRRYRSGVWQSWVALH